MSGLTINSNIQSVVAQHNFARASAAVAGSTERLATGLRINRGADDPAGLISSEALSAQIASLQAESDGAERSDQIASVADGALGEVSGLLNDANAAAIANANTGGMSQAERDANQMEIDSDVQSVDRIAAGTTFDGQNVLDGSMTLSAGAASLPISSVESVDTGGVVVNSGTASLTDVQSGGALDTSGGDVAGAQASIQAAASQVATLRGQIGAFQSDTIGPEIRSNDAAVENMSAARSAIADTDYASESASLVRARILQSSTLGVLTLANGSAASALALLG